MDHNFVRSGGRTRAHTPPKSGRKATSKILNCGTFLRLAADHPKALLEGNDKKTHVCTEGECGDEGGLFFSLTKDEKGNWATSKAVNHSKRNHNVLYAA